MNRCIALLAVLAFGVASVSCAGNQPAPTTGTPVAVVDTPSVVSALPTATSGPQSVFPLTVIDDAERKVTIPSEPQRIVSLSPSNTELVYGLGLEDKLVGVDDYSDYPPEAKAKEKVGDFAGPSLEKVVSLAPDLVLASHLHVATVVPELEKRGIATLVLQPPKLANVLDSLSLLGKVGGASEAAQRAVADFNRRIEAVISTTSVASNCPRVFFELSPDLFTVGADTFVDDMISKAGGYNIARDVQGAWPKLNPEDVVAKDPEVIILSDHGTNDGQVTEEMVKARPGWHAISAVKNGRIVGVEDADIVNRPSQRAVDGLEFLARAIHPELFR